MAEAKTETATKAKKTVVAGEKPAAAKAVKPVATAKPAKAVAAKPAVKKTAAAKPAVSKAKTLKNVTPEQRYRMICDAAYFRAEKRNFAPENEIQDWLDAEAEINRLLGK